MYLSAFPPTTQLTSSPLATAYSLKPSTLSDLKALSSHITANIVALQARRQRFLIRASGCAVFFLGSVLYSLHSYFYTSVFPRTAVVIAGCSLCWLLLAVASGLYKAYTKAPRAYAQAVNRWLRVFGLEYDKRQWRLREWAPRPSDYKQSALTVPSPTLFGVVPANLRRDDKVLTSTLQQRRVKASREQFFEEAEAEDSDHGSGIKNKLQPVR